MRPLLSHICRFTPFLALLIVGPVQASQPHEDLIRQHLVTEVTRWLNEPIVIESIKAQNKKHENIGQADIERLDKQWRNETKRVDGPLIKATLKNRLSRYLKTKKEQGQGRFTEIFVMDNRGLNVGQSDVTSDYWQGDEAKWKKTFLAGAGKIHIGQVKFDESSQTLQAQLSMSIADPDNDTPIGAITIGVDVELLGQ